jgi:hypothetical protein
MACEVTSVPTIKRILAIAVLLGLPLSGRTLGQESGQKITFHVTAVRSEEAHDYCTTGDCSATRFTVEGYSDVKGDSILTEYVLECIEVIASRPTPHRTNVCGRVHAHNDYEAKLWSDSIFFGDETKPPSSEDLITVAYRIVSEKEVKKQKR